MPTIEASIEGALFARVETLSLTPALRIAWPNEHFEPEQDETFLEVLHLPNNNSRPFMGTADPHEFSGILQIAIRAPVGGPRGIDVTEIAGNVVSHFAAGTTLSKDGVRVKITRRPDIASGIREDAAWVVPVTVSYQSFN